MCVVIEDGNVFDLLEQAAISLLEVRFWKWLRLAKGRNCS
jgi:hypothetical protein